MKENEKKKVILMIVGVIALMIVVVGATYAYFQAQIGKGDSVQINAQAGTTDSLSFNISDIDVTDNANKILDENANDANIIINANQTNFGPNGNSLGDGVKLNAHLIAGNDDNDAHYEYYVYLNISANNLEYTTPESTPELVLVVQKPDGKYLDEIEGLEKDEITLGEESVPCFDITKASGLITIASKYKIDATEETQGEADQNWQVKVIFKNLDTDQHLNTNKTFQANLSIQSEKINYLDFASYAKCEYGRCEYDDYRNLGEMTGYDEYDQPIYNGYSGKIKNVIFVNNIVEEELNLIDSWDLSSNKDGSIMGWLKANEDPDVPYDLYIGSNLKDEEKIKIRSFANAFQGLKNVETIDLNLSILDMSNLTDTSYMFEGMTSLTEIIGIEDLDVSNVINMEAMFSTIGVTKLNLSKWNTSNVKNMNTMFVASAYLNPPSQGLTELDLSGWNTHNVTNMSSMFAGGFSDSHIEKIIGIEDLDVSNVTDMSYMFNRVISLTELDLSRWDTSNVTNMSRMFEGASSLTSINMQNATFSQVTSYGSMFYNTSSSLKVSITGEENKNWFLNSISNDTSYYGFGLKEEQLNVLPE